MLDARVAVAGAIGALVVGMVAGHPAPGSSLSSTSTPAHSHQPQDEEAPRAGADGGQDGPGDVELATQKSAGAGGAVEPAHESTMADAPSSSLGNDVNAGQEQDGDDGIDRNNDAKLIKEAEVLLRRRGLTMKDMQWR